MLGGKEFLILSTHGGIRADDGTPIALGYHTGHWEVGLLMQAAARELKRLGRSPSPASVTDPCDGRTQGTPGMMDSLPYRNDAAIVLRRLIRSLPTRRGRHGRRHLRQGPARDDDGPGRDARPAVRPRARRRHAPADRWRRRRQNSDHRRPLSPTARSRSKRPPRWAAAPAARPGGGCQFLGTAATSQVVGEALGMSLPHSALAPSGQPIWLDMAARSARAGSSGSQRGSRCDKS